MAVFRRSACSFFSGRDWRSDPSDRDRSINYSRKESEWPKPADREVRRGYRDAVGGCRSAAWQSTRPTRRSPVIRTGIAPFLGPDVLKTAESRSAAFDEISDTAATVDSLCHVCRVFQNHLLDFLGQERKFGKLYDLNPLERIVVVLGLPPPLWAPNHECSIPIANQVVVL